MILQNIKNVLRNIGEFLIVSQVELEGVLDAWMHGKPRKGKLYWTDGEFVYYHDSKVLKRTPRGFALSNQGWVTSTTISVFMTILQVLAGYNYYVFKRGSKMFIEDKASGKIFEIPTGRDKWIEFTENGALIEEGLKEYTYEETERETREFTKKINQILNKILTQLTLTGDFYELSDLEIPELGMTFGELFEDYIRPRRKIYDFYTDRMNDFIKTYSDMFKDDLRYAIRKFFETGRLR